MRYEYYDFLEHYDRYYFKRRTLEIEKALRYSNKHIKILEGGCGTGNFIRFLLDKGFNNVYGIDINKELLGHAQRQCPQGKISYGTITKTKFNDNYFDVVLLLDVIEHLGDYSAAFKETKRILKKGGLLIITYPNPYLVPFFNFTSKIGLRVYATDGKVYLKDLFAKTNGFRIKQTATRMLISKMPKPILDIFERIEHFFGDGIMRRIGFFHFIVLEKL